MLKLKDLLSEVIVLDEPGAQRLALRMQKEIKAPYVEASVSTLGGKERPSVMLRIALDSRDTWANGIYHNARGSMWDIDYMGTIEQHYLTLHPDPRPWNKFRKAKYKTHDEAIKKINTWIDKVL